MNRRLNNLLPFRVSGVVVEGKKRGRALGFPTANIVPHGGVMPDLPHGVYAARLKLGKRQYKAMAGFGAPETFEETVPRLEAHIFSYRSELYGREIALELMAYLRPYKKFESADELKAAMAEDREKALQILKNTKITDTEY